MAEKKVIQLDLQTNTDFTVTALKKAQREVAILSEKFGATSREAVEAAKQAAILKDKIGDAKALTDAFNPDAKFKALSGSLTGVAGGFSVVTGAMGTLGVESESVEKTLLKVQSAMALASGAQALGESIDSFKQLGAVAKNALTGIRTGIAATGIGLFVVALGTIVAYWDEIKTAVGGVSEAQDDLNLKASANTELEKDKLTTLTSQDNILKLQGKSEEEILKLKILQTEAVIKTTEEEIKQKEITAKLEIKAAERNASIMKMILKGAMEFGALGLRLLVAPIDLVLTTANKVSEALGFGKLTAVNLNEEISNLINFGADKVTSFVFDPAATKAAAAADIKETKDSLAKMKNEVAGFKLQVIELNKPSEVAKKEIEKADTEYKRNALERQQEFDNKIEEIAEQNYLNSLTEKEKEIQLANDKYFELETLAAENKDQLAVIELAKMNELNEINLKYQDIAYKADQEAKDKKAEADKAAAAKEIEEAKAVAEQKAAIQQQGLDTALQGIQLIKGLFDKSKGVQKAAVIAESAIGIAKMVIANKLANIGALATPQAIATSGAAAAPVIAMNNISTGIGIAGNIAATAKALQALGGGTPPSNPSGNSGGAGTSVMSPNFNVVGNSGLNQLAQLQQQPTKAYVVSGDMTTAQALDRNRIENATLVQ